MKILSISTILPIPDIDQSNDFVFHTYENYQKIYRDDTVVIIRPVKIDLNLLKVIRKSTILKKLKGNKNLNYRNYRVEFFPFLSFWSFRNFHALLTESLYFLNRKRIEALFKEHRFDVIHAQFILSDGLLAYRLSKKYNIPYIITTHNERFYFDHYFSRQIATKILANASKVLPINHSNSEYYVSLGLKNIHLTPLGFSNLFVRPQKLTNNQPISILTVATLIKLKNIDKVILAIKNLVDKYPLTYTIVGKGPERNALHKLVHSLNIADKVLFIENVPHEKISDEMYKHDIFIMPSYFETFGRVYFEAMAMGIPIICAKNSGIFGIFKDGKEGIAVDHKNIEEISSALEVLIANKNNRLEMGFAGQELVKNFTWENIAKQINHFYLEAIENHTKTSK